MCGRGMCIANTSIRTFGQDPYSVPMAISCANVSKIDRCKLRYSNTAVELHC